MIEVECLRILSAEVKVVDFNHLRNFVFDEIENIEIEIFS